MADADKDLDISIGESGSREVASIQELLAECGVDEYDPRVVGMLVDMQYALTTKILEMANGCSKHSDKPTIDVEDVQTATDVLELMKNSHIERDRMLSLATEKNAQPLPQIRHNYGLKLPNDRFCQLQQNVVFRNDEYEQMDTHQAPRQQFSMEAPIPMVRPEHIQNSLKRRAPDDDFDS